MFAFAKSWSHLVHSIGYLLLVRASLVVVVIVFFVSVTCQVMVVFTCQAHILGLLRHPLLVLQPSNCGER